MPVLTFDSRDIFCEYVRRKVIEGICKLDSEDYASVGRRVGASTSAIKGIYEGARIDYQVFDALLRIANVVGVRIPIKIDGVIHDLKTLDFDAIMRECSIAISGMTNVQRTAFRKHVDTQIYEALLFENKVNRRVYAATGTFNVSKLVLLPAYSSCTKRIIFPSGRLSKD